MTDRRRQPLFRASLLFAAALALSLFAASAPASAESGRSDDDPLLAPVGPIVDGKKLQPRAEQTVSGSSRLSDDPQLKSLYEGVMKDSDPSTYRRNREPTAH